jgi:hypothetical protein
MPPYDSTRSHRQRADPFERRMIDVFEQELQIGVCTAAQPPFSQDTQQDVLFAPSGIAVSAQHAQYE